MLLLPYEHYTIKTTLRIQDVLIKLEDTIGPMQLFSGQRSTKKPYEGSVEADAFSARPVKTGYRDSFLPLIQGKITQEMGGCSVAITVRPNTILLLFIVLWIGGVGFAFFRALWSTLGVIFLGYLETSPVTLPLLPLAISGGMLILGYGLVWQSFKAEAGKTKRFFQKLLDENYQEEEDLEGLLDED